MAITGVKILQLGVAGSLTGSEYVEIVKGGVNKRTTLQSIANLAVVTGAITGTGTIGFSPIITDTDDDGNITEIGNGVTSYIDNTLETTFGAQTGQPARNIQYVRGGTSNNNFAIFDQFVDDGSVSGHGTPTVGMSVYNTSFSYNANIQVTPTGASIRSSNNTGGESLMIFKPGGAIELSSTDYFKINVTGFAGSKVLINDGSLKLNESITTATELELLSGKSYVGSGDVETISVAGVNGFTGTSDGDPANPTITLTTTVVGIMKGDGTSMNAAVADTDYATPSYVNTQITAAIVGYVIDKGNFTPSGNYPSTGSIKKGWLYTINGLGAGVSGTMGSQTVTDGDAVRALVDTPGQTDSNWAISENNFGYVAANASTTLTINGTTQSLATNRTWNVGTVTVVSVTTANGISGSVATDTTTPAITLTLGAITPTSVNGLTITTTSGTLTIASAKTFTVSQSITLTSDGTGTRTLDIGAGGTLGSAAFTAASAYEVPLTISTGLTRATNTITNDLSTGKSGGQTIKFGTAATDVATFISTTGNQTVAASAIFSFKNGNNGNNGLFSFGDHPSGGINQTGFWVQNQTTAATAWLRASASTAYFNSNSDTRLQVAAVDYIVMTSGTATVSMRKELTMNDGVNCSTGTTTGSKQHTATSQKWSVWNATPIIQPASANQAAVAAQTQDTLTDSTTGTPGTTINDVGAVFSQATTNNNFASLVAQLAKIKTDIANMKTLQNQIRTDMINIGLIKGAA